MFVAGTEIDGSRVEVVLAKPVDKNDPSRQKKAAQEQQAALAANPLFQVPVIEILIDMKTKFMLCGIFDHKKIFVQSEVIPCKIYL